MKQLTIHYTHKSGYDCTITLESDDSRELFALGDKAIEYLRRTGCKPAAAQPTAARPADSAPQTESTAESFIASSLSADVLDGKSYWKIRGGRFKKHGIRVWPEVLEAAGLAADLNPLSPPSVAGWKAEFIRKADGKIDKIIRLRRA